MRMKKISALFLLFSLLLSTLLSCTNNVRPPETDEELLRIAEALCEESKAVNSLCFGDGILPKENGYKIGAYVEADKESLSLYGIERVSDIEAKIKSVYTYSTYIWIRDTVLSSDKSESDATVLSYARYYDGERETDGTKSHVLMVRTSYEQRAFGEILYSNYRMEKTEGKDSFRFLVTVTVKDGEKETVYPDESILVYRESGVWLLDTPTYATVGK